MKTIVRTVFLVFGVILPISTGISFANVLNSWHWRNPTPFPDTMQSICFGDGKFVAVGAGGVIHTSFDGNSWDSGQRPVLAALHQIIFENGLFVAVGDNGTIVTSTNDVNWMPQISGTTNDLFAVVAGNGMYLACGRNGQTVRSTDGVNWSPASAGNSDLYWLNYGNGVFIVRDASQSMTFQVSSDGVNWTSSTLVDPTPTLVNNHALLQMEFGNGIFLAVVYDEDNYDHPTTHLFQSTDGVNWAMGTQFLPGPAQFNFLTFANGSFYECNPGVIGQQFYAAKDSSSYAIAGVLQNANNVHYLAYGNGQYVLIGDNGSSWVSPDLTNWAGTFGGTQYTFERTIFGSDRIVALANSPTVFSSSDGIHFNPTVIVPATNLPSSTVSDIAFDGTNYVVVGGSSTGIFQPKTYMGEIYTSTNGTDWVARTSNANQLLNSLCRGADRWVAVGNNGAVISSPNTLAWTLRASGTGNNLTGVAYGNGTYVAVGSGGTVISSSDGATWDVQYSGTVSSLHCVRFFEGKFLAAGDGGTIITSADGVNWSSVNSGTTNSITSVDYGNGEYAACGTGLLLTSIDGVTWQDISAKFPTIASPISIDFVNQSFWISGVSGMLLQSDSADEVPRLAGNMSPGKKGFQLSVSINVPANYRIQFSTNCESWQDVDFLTNGLTPSSWVDSNAFRFSQGFYRIAVP